MAGKSAFGFGTPFFEQLAFFRQKLNLPSERWDDITKAAHDRAFIVAGAGKADLLDDLRRAMDKAMAHGGGLEEFRRDFKQIVFNHGWSGWTGQGTKAGEAWRTRIIYQTNMATSYAAGRWQQLNDPGLLKLRPYWRYNHADGVLHPRPLHLAWNGVTLRHDDPFWRTHFAPNGWGCHCYITAASEADYSAAKAAGKGAAPEGWDAVSPKTGAPVGIDKGFDYAPGASVDTPLRQMVQDKLINYPPAISRALTKDLNRYIETAFPPAEFAAMAAADKALTDTLWVGFVERAAEIKAVTDIDLTGYPILFPANAARHIEIAHGKDGESQRPPTPDDYALIASAVNDYDSVRTGKIVNGMRRILFIKNVEQEIMRWVFEVRPGKKNRSLTLVSLLIKAGLK